MRSAKLDKGLPRSLQYETMENGRSKVAMKGHLPRISSALAKRVDTEARKRLVREAHAIYIKHSMTLKQLSESAGLSPAWWSKRFRELGLEAHPTSHRSPKYICRRSFLIRNERAFAIIKDGETAYWLGFIWADGYPTKSGLRVCLQIGDFGHLEKLRSFLGTDAMVIQRPAPYPGASRQASLEVHSMHLLRDLEKLGLIPRRSERNRAPPAIPDPFLADFFRGLIDGDGQLFRDPRQTFFLSGWRLVLTGSNAITRAFDQFLFQQTDKHFRVESNGDNPRNQKLSIFGPYAISLCGKLYEREGPALSRKANLARLLWKYYQKAGELGLGIADHGGRVVFCGKSSSVQSLETHFRSELEQLTSRSTRLAIQHMSG